MSRRISKLACGRAYRAGGRVVASSRLRTGTSNLNTLAAAPCRVSAIGTGHPRSIPALRYKSTMTEATANPLSGLWKPTHLQALWYGPNSVKSHLLESLPQESSKAFIVTGSSLATKTPLIRQTEEFLGPKHHAGTFANIKQHAPVAQLDEATDAVIKDPSIDTIISIGGGSPIDSCKAISYRLNEKVGKYLFHISIPTTLSAAECSMNAGYTQEDGIKTGVANPKLAPHVIIYDAGLPKYKDDPKNEDNITQLQLASFASLGFLGLNIKGALGLSHTLGYALGSPYSIPHGITSCLTLGHVVKLKAQDPQAAAQIARLAPFLGLTRSGDDQQDATEVGGAILDLVKLLGLATTLNEYNVEQDQIPIIVKRATRQEQGDLYDQVAKLVRALY
ncbi:putative alcohol dehydrogenase protein [Neofusicoccum parvum UCRNP2]|uniref:Putative alcohol dehydrogenase protein n=1 Tax=Botryosphaeria parva (strain UCR-NP2) TaxID=1287680 RepID=R1FWJ6_BOTPV|nr:putative alcohol dehydrogenase protein [Neofusicoccum parvum UCRNP2]